MKEYDLLIIGGGSAGMMAAVTAAEKGVGRIAILEKGAALGGNSLCAGTIFSTAFRDWGSYEKDENVDILFRTTMHGLHGLGNPRLIRRYLKRVKEVARFFEKRDVRMEKLQGGKFAINGSMNVESYESCGLGVILCRCLKEELLKYPNIEIYLKTPALHLLTDETGSVSGAETEKGLIQARQVILSTGGAAGTAESISKYVPWCVESQEDEIRPAGMPLCTGDGIRMCKEIGADAGHGVNIHLLPPWFGGHQFTRFGMLLEHPEALLIGADGTRLTDESESFDEVLEIVNTRPKKVCYALFDENGIRSLWNRTDRIPDTEGFFARFYSSVKFGTSFETMERDFAVDFANGFIRKLDSLEDTARCIGAKPDVLKAAVEEYNRAVETGYDDLFCKPAEYLTLPVKNGPFYLLLGRRSCDSTQGGIPCDAELRPVRPDGTTMNGIFVCGDPVGGFVAEKYYAPGGAGFTFALTSGMMAAEQAAELLNK